MRTLRIGCVAACLVLVVSACGDDDTGTTAEVSTTESAAATDAPTTTTAAAPPTTLASTTTEAADAHQVFGLSWSDVWPADGATAVYRVTEWGGAQEDVAAIIEYGVEFRGETFDRLTFGTPEPGNNAMVVYLDRSEPWKIGIKAVATYRMDVLDGPIIIETYDTPVVFDGSLPQGESAPTDVEVVLEFSDRDERMPATYDLTLVSVGDSVDVPFGTVTGTALLIGSVIGEEFVGGTEPLLAELWLHPQHMIVKMTGSPAFNVIEILETWG